MKVLKASAGAGKTYRLSKHYRELLLGSDDPRAYRNILAVTFTNKAAADMKRRILSDLYKESLNNPEAGKRLRLLLHDYGAFSVCTIDKFFQRTLKAFAHEAGCFTDYQVELDKKLLVGQAMDRILDSLTEDNTQLLSWIRGSLEETLRDGRKFRPDQGLKEIGEGLKSEARRTVAEQYGINDAQYYSKERLSALRKECRSIISSFEKAMKGFGLEFESGTRITFKTKKAFNELPEDGRDYFNEHKTLYYTAFAINEQIYSLGLAGEFDREFAALLKEKNLMCLDESNLILRDIIDGSDAPFVYERLGVRYRHFLLDEFQDTSNIQWQNFLPLLRESEASGGSNLIVGDVKQSIYRFRDSDWRLLHEKVQAAFNRADDETLGENWRSARTIVEFNNAYFKFAAEKTGLKDMYGDVHQDVRSKETQSGSVKLTFCDDQFAAILDSLHDAFSRGARPGDIVVLVRNRLEGSKVASRLIDEGIDVISDDSLKLKSSPTVRRVVSLLSLMDNPGNLVDGYFAAALDIVPPSDYHSLTDLCEELLRSLQASLPGSVAADTLFVQAFLDDVQTWCETNGNNLGKFLEHWASADPSINCPENSSAVRIMTIHKSKGLEFKKVIFPFAEKVGFFKPQKCWCHLDSQTALEGLYSINLSSTSEDSLFARDYRREQQLQMVDNLNTFYVALTRAEKELHIISETPSKKFRDALAKKPEPKSFAQLLYMYCGGLDEVLYGEPYDYTKVSREKEEFIPFESSFSSVALGGRLNASDDAMDFFGDDGSVGPEASQRLSGILLHDILSCVNALEDVAPAVRNAVAGGKCPAREERNCLNLLSKAVASQSRWFTSRGRNEVALYDERGNEKRPDRVVIADDGSVEIIDYKFGSFEKKYEYQIRDYMKIYRALGYGNVKGYLWFVRTGEIMEFTSGR